MRGPQCTARPGEGTGRAGEGKGEGGGRLPAHALQEAAHRHLWLHFTRMSSYAGTDVPVIVRGSGQYVYDQNGKRYLDGLSGLFVSQIGHGRREVAWAAAPQRLPPPALP